MILCSNHPSEQGPKPDLARRRTLEPHNETHTHGRAGTIPAPASKVRMEEQEVQRPRSWAWAPGPESIPFLGRRGRTVPADRDPPSPPKPGPKGSRAGWRDPHGRGGSDHPQKGHPKPCLTAGEVWAWEEQHPGPKFRCSQGRWWEFWAGFPGTSSLLCSPDRRTKVKHRQSQE